MCSYLSSWNSSLVVNWDKNLFVDHFSEEIVYRTHTIDIRLNGLQMEEWRVGSFFFVDDDLSLGFNQAIARLIQLIIPICSLLISIEVVRWLELLLHRLKYAKTGKAQRRAKTSMIEKKGKRKREREHEEN